MLYHWASIVAYNAHHLSSLVWWMQDASFFSTSGSITRTLSGGLGLHNCDQPRMTPDTNCLCQPLELDCHFLSRGICQTITEQSPQRDKVLQRGAHIRPHLVKVHSVTKYCSDEGHISDHIWLKSAAWQSPLMRGTFWTTFGQIPQHDKVLQWGAHFGPCLVKVCCVTKSSDKGNIFRPHLVKVHCVTKSSDKRRVSDHIW